MSAQKRSKATRAIEYAVEAGAHLWHDPDACAYVDTYDEGGKRRTLRVRSRSCRTWLSGLMFSHEGNALGGQAASDAIDVLEAMAIQDGPEREIHVRLAIHGKSLYLDLGDSSWRAVQIDGGGWRLVEKPPVRFRRPRGLRPLPVPSHDGDGWDGLRTVLHDPAERDLILLVSWLVGCLHPSGPYPILALTGEQGSAKTTVGRLLRSIVDPSEAPLRSPPRNDRELVIAARNSHIVGLDNLSRIHEWLSDGLCRIATGGGYSARELYSDGDEVIYSDRRPIILTSIEDVATRGDLADRTLAVTLPRIPEGARKTEREVYAEMDRKRPSILGALLDSVSTGLTRFSSVELDRLPRMADFAKWVVACEPSLPWAEGAFVAAYSDARDDLVETSIEADPIATAILELVRAKGAWSGTATELLSALNARQTTSTPRHWPETPQAMGGRITRAAPLLRAAGWNVEKGTGRDRRTTYITPIEHNSAGERHERHATSHSAKGGGFAGDEANRKVGDTRHVQPSVTDADVTTCDDGDKSSHSCAMRPSDTMDLFEGLEVES